MTAHDDGRKGAEDAKRQLLDDWEQAQASRLSVEEIAGIRTMLKNRERWVWFRDSLKTWAIWLVAVLGAYTVGVEALVKAVKALSDK